MKKIIIVGASSGMGRAVAEQLAEKGYKTGITGRRENLLQEVQQKYPDNILYEAFDITQEDAIARLQKLIEALGGCDLLLISAGRGIVNPALDPAPEEETVALNVTAFTRVAVFAFRYFWEQGHGHLAAITSISAIRGRREAPAYGASKAYQAHYLEALRQKVVKKKLPITVTDIQPGFVATKLPDNMKVFWLVPLEKAARRIVWALEAKKHKVYVSRRWWIVAQALKRVPAFIYEKT